MRSTFNIDDEIYMQIKHIARSRKKSLGEIISHYLLVGLSTKEDQQPKEKPKYRIKFPTLPIQPGRGLMTDEMVKKIREEEGI